MKETKKRNNKTVLHQMPSLLAWNDKLVFGSNWPLSKKLPNLPRNKCEKVEEEQKLQTVGIKKSNKKRVGLPKCGHNKSEIYARDVCQKCYNKLYNKVSRKGKYIR